MLVDSFISPGVIVRLQLSEYLFYVGNINERSVMLVVRVIIILGMLDRVIDSCLLLYPKYNYCLFQSNYRIELNFRHF